MYLIPKTYAQHKAKLAAKKSSQKSPTDTAPRLDRPAARSKVPAKEFTYAR